MLQMEDVNEQEGGWPIYLGMLNRKDKLAVMVALFTCCQLLLMFLWTYFVTSLPSWIFSVVKILNLQDLYPASLEF